MKLQERIEQFIINYFYLYPREAKIFVNVVSLFFMFIGCCLFGWLFWEISH